LFATDPISGENYAVVLKDLGLLESVRLRAGVKPSVDGNAVGFNVLILVVFDDL
jgi:hypothetical protein